MEAFAGSQGTELCPDGLPIITAEVLNTVDSLRALRDAGAKHRVNMGGRETGLVLTTHDATSRAMTDPRLLGAPPRSRDARAGDPDDLVDEEDLFFLPQDEHARLRHLVVRQLTHRRTAALVPRIQGEVEKLLAATAGATVVDFAADVGRPLPVAVLCELLGVPDEGRGYLRDYVFGWAGGSDAVPTVTKSAGLLMAEYLRDLIARRRAAPGDDLISGMIRERDAGGDRDILSAVRLLLVAGHQPVTRLLVNGLRVLLTPRSRWEWLRQDPARLDPTIEELLRVVTPTALASRYADEDIEFDGEPLPVGQGVHCALKAANRDPARFADPDVFDPQRPSNPHLSFGLGRRHCPGAALARAEARVAFGTLLQRCPRLRLAEKHETDGRPLSGRYLPVILDPGASGAGR